MIPLRCHSVFVYLSLKTCMTMSQGGVLFSLKRTIGCRFASQKAKRALVKTQYCGRRLVLT